MFCRGCRRIHTAQINWNFPGLCAQLCRSSSDTKQRNCALQIPTRLGAELQGCRKSLTSLWLLGFQLPLVNGGRREIQISCFFLWVDHRSCMGKHVHRTAFCACVYVRGATWRLWLAFCPDTAQVVARRASGDASIRLAVRVSCQFTSSDVKAIPAAFIATTYSITVTAKRIKPKMTAPHPPPQPVKMPRRADPLETRGVDFQKVKSRFKKRILAHLSGWIIFLSWFKVVRRRVEVLLCDLSWFFTFPDPLKGSVLSDPEAQWAV